MLEECKYPVQVSNNLMRPSWTLKSTRNIKIFPPAAIAGAIANQVLGFVLGKEKVCQSCIAERPHFHWNKGETCRIPVYPRHTPLEVQQYEQQLMQIVPPLTSWRLLIGAVNQHLPTAITSHSGQVFLELSSPTVAN